MCFLVSYTNLHKIRSRQPKGLKLGGVITLYSVSQIWDFQIPATWNDVMMTPPLFLSESVHKTCQRQPTALKLFRLIFHKICKFENHVIWNDIIMMSLLKTMEKQWEMQTSAEPNEIYIVWKVLMRAIQKCNFYWIWATLSKCYGHLYQVLSWPLTKYGHVTWPWLQILKIFIFRLILY